MLYQRSIILRQATRRTSHSVQAYRYYGQNRIEKIVQKFLLPSDSNTTVHSGDYVTIQPKHFMTHDNSGAVINKFNSIGLTKIHNPKQIVFTLDHDIQNKTEANLKKYAKIGEFAKSKGIDFYPAGRGIGHQVLLEEGYAFPNSMTVASDSHSNMYGGIGCLGTPFVRTDAAAVWATGNTWWQIPEVVKLRFEGKLKPGVTGKDVIITLCNAFGNDEVLNCAIECEGEGISNLSIDDRLTIANMSTEWGALAAVFPVDQLTIDWMKTRSNILNRNNQAHPRINSNTINEVESSPVLADNDAVYTKVLTLDLSTVTPYASGPNSVKVATSIKELQDQDIKIHKAYLVSCVNSRASDIKQAAEVVKNKKLAPGVEFYIAAASDQVQQQMEESGDWKTLIDAGAIPLPSGCGPCIGLGTGLLKDNEVGISATNRNFKGRMGSRKSLAYLASPAVVAASALQGRIALPDHLKNTFSASTLPQTSIQIDSNANSASSSSSSQSYEILPKFPSDIRGRLIFCNANNLNTDGIYAGVHTYNDNITREQMGEYVMENYDPNFKSLVQKSDILVTGYNFGSGSSREQAATVFLSCGIDLVIAGSFSETYKRNAINNGLLVIECPELVSDLAEEFSSSVPSVKPGYDLHFDVAKGIINIYNGETLSKSYQLRGSIGKEVQKLYLTGGLENLLKQQAESTK